MQSKWVVFVVYFLSSVRASKFFMVSVKSKERLLTQKCPQNDLLIYPVPSYSVDMRKREKQVKVKREKSGYIFHSVTLVCYWN